MPEQAPAPRFPVVPELFRIGEAVRAAGGRPVLVGGWVRDTMLGIPHRKDYDVEVFGLPLNRLRPVLRRFGAVHSVGRHFGVLKLTTADAEYDVSVPRRESNIGKGHKGFWVKADPHMSFEEAASRRDFTINAMGYAFLDDALLDPFGGERDLRSGLLRHVGPAFGEDPLRVLRAMQFAGRFELDIAPETLAICRAQDLAELPRERIWEEFRKLLLLARRPSLGLGYAHALGVLAWFPELQALHDLDFPVPPEGHLRPWALTLAVVDRAADRRTGDADADLVLMYAALCHLMGLAAPVAPATPGAPDVPRADADRVVGAFLARLTNSTDFLRRVLTLLGDLDTPGRLHAQHLDAPARPPGTGPAPWEGGVRRLALRVAIPALLRLAAARHEALHPGEAFAAGEWLEAQARRLGVWEGPPEPILKGRHLVQRGMRQGPAMGRVLKAAFERQLDGEIASLDDALAWLAREAPPELAAAQPEADGPP